MTMSYCYALAVLHALDDPEEAKKHSDSTIMAAIQTALNVDEKTVKKHEWVNAVRYLLERVKDG